MCENSIRFGPILLPLGLAGARVMRDNEVGL
jgi:hypothetical protein